MLRLPNFNMLFQLVLTKFFKSELFSRLLKVDHVITSCKEPIAFYLSVKSKLQHAPPPGIPRAFDTFAVPGRREFDYQSLPGGGEFDPHALGVGNLNCTLDFM